MAKSRQVGLKISAVRLDSGDLDALSRDVRAVLDRAGLQHVRILASGGLDEHEVARLVTSGAPIDSFGVGTNMGVSADRPSLDMAYNSSSMTARAVSRFLREKQHCPGESRSTGTPTRAHTRATNSASQPKPGPPREQIKADNCRN